VARQYLDSTAGRHFVDSLSHLVSVDTATAQEISDALAGSKMGRQTAWFWKDFSKFRAYESTPAGLVNKLLEDDESAISTFVDQLIADVMAQGGTVPYSEILVPEQTAEVQIKLHGQDKTFSIGYGTDGFLNAFEAKDGEYDTENSIDFQYPHQLLSRQFPDPNDRDEDGPGVNGPRDDFQDGPDANVPHWSDPDADRGPHFRR